ncbi:porin [Shewanella sp. SR44-3]|uniref:porin n=1 Tax=unclassified Shewanella TaxID=196818 RepID=UPI0015FE3A9E|nr:porin [Shewanella sp. SR44-3]MBB1270621.1 porin [Shewanella sp. SR44-3]
MKQAYLAGLISALMATPAVAIEIYKDDTNAVKIGGWIDVRAIDTQGVSEVANGASRINFAFDRKLKNDWQAFAKLEWGINPVGSGKVIYNGDESFESAQDDFMYNRLGYAGLSHADYGTLTLGKQWGAWYDVVSHTNLAFFTDGNASGTYTYNKFDGAVNGTGRGDKIVQYRNSLGEVSFAAQIQLKSEKVTLDKANDPLEVSRLDYSNTAGLGVTYQVNELWLVTFGGNYGQVDGSRADGTSFDETDYIYGLGFAYGQWDVAGFYAAANINWNQFHDTDNLNRMIPESKGVESIMAYQYDNGIRFMLTYNLLEAGDEYAKAYQGDVFKRQSMVAGVHYLFDTSTVVFAEFSKNLGDFKGQKEAAMELSEDDAFLIGLRYSL